MPTITQREFLTILGGHGTRINWYSKTTGSDDPFDTGSTSTYGYGDPSIILASGSFQAVIRPAMIKEELIEPGFYLEDYRELFFRRSDTPDYFDYASFDNQLWLIQPVQPRIDGGNIIFKRVRARALIPSGSNQILPDYLSQVLP